MKLSLFVFACLAFAMAADAQKVCPPELAKKADEAFLEMVLYGDNKTTWPTNEVEIARLCSSHKTNEKIVKKYTRNCISGLPQQVMALVLKGAQSIFKRFCSPGANTQEVFKYGACGNSDNRHDHACMTHYVQSAKNSLSLGEDARLAGACCSFNDFEGCIINRMRREPQCSSEAISFFKKIIKSIAGDALDLTCTEYKKNPELCTSIMKKQKHVNHPGRSLLLPLVSVMQSLS